MSTDEQGHNGWTNKQTWCINLWLDNERGTYDAANEIVNQEQSVHDASDALEQYVNELAEVVRPGIFEGASFVSDMFRSALAAVDWRELVENRLSDSDAFHIDDGDIVPIDDDTTLTDGSLADVTDASTE